MLLIRSNKSLINWKSGKENCKQLWWFENKPKPFLWLSSIIDLVVFNPQQFQTIQVAHHMLGPVLSLPKHNLDWVFINMLAAYIHSILLFTQVSNLSWKEIDLGYLSPITVTANFPRSKVAETWKALTWFGHAFTSDLVWISIDWCSGELASLTAEVLPYLSVLESILRH